MCMGYGYCCCCGNCTYSARSFREPFTAFQSQNSTIASGSITAEVVEDDGSTIKCKGTIGAQSRPCLQLSSNVTYANLYNPPALVTWSAHCPFGIWLWEWEPDNTEHQCSTRIDEQLREDIKGRSFGLNWIIELGNISGHSAYAPMVFVEQDGIVYIKFAGFDAGGLVVNGNNGAVTHMSVIAGNAGQGVYYVPDLVAGSWYRDIPDQVSEPYTQMTPAGLWSRGPSTAANGWYKIADVAGVPTLVTADPDNSIGATPWRIGVGSWHAGSQNPGSNGGQLNFTSESQVRRFDNICILVDP